MNIIKRSLLLLMALVLVAAMATIPAFAAEDDALAVTLTADKQTYGADEDIVATLTVTNTLDVPVYDVSLEHLIPDGYELASGCESLKQVEVLEAGESVELVVTYVTENVPVTGDLLPVALMLILIGGMAALVFMGKAGKKYLCVVLCVVMVGSFGLIQAEAAETAPIHVSTTVQVDGQELVLNAVVNYTVEQVPAAQPGRLSGMVCQASDRVTPIQDAAIQVYRGETLCTSLSTDAEGKFSLELDPGEYVIKVSAQGYLGAEAHTTVTEGEHTYLETFMLVQDVGASSGTASGTIYNALTGSGIEGVELTARRNWNAPATGDVITTTTTDANGAYSLTLPLGNYTLFAEKDGFISITVNILVQEGTTGDQNGTMSPVIAGNEFRIVVTWDKDPDDVDSHMVGTLSDGEPFHVYYNDQEMMDNGEVICSLDVDDTSSYGPETITVKAVSDAPYYYYLKRYDGEGSLSSSGAQVKVYQGEALVATFNVPTDQGTEDHWNVFAIVDGTLVVENTITTDPDTTYAD